mmetsp:Transcript_6689/g.18649  ORF Transcript_6689/g.18649 Transcript_6689/m.18649 type:complete len:205 (-) Transcript_6689:753-1367(-)
MCWCQAHPRWVGKRPDLVGKGARKMFGPKGSPKQPGLATARPGECARPAEGRHSPRTKFRPHLTPLPCSSTNASLSPLTVRSSEYSPMSPFREMRRVPPSAVFVHVALHFIWFLCPSFQSYSLSNGMSSRRSPMALWFTNLITSLSQVKSQLGQAADIAIFRWNMPTPVAFKKSSRPKVSTHFQWPTSGAPPSRPSAFEVASTV